MLLKSDLQERRIDRGLDILEDILVLYHLTAMIQRICAVGSWKGLATGPGTRYKGRAKVPAIHRTHIPILNPLSHHSLSQTSTNSTSPDKFLPSTQ